MWIKTNQTLSYGSEKPQVLTVEGPQLSLVPTLPDSCEWPLHSILMYRMDIIDCVVHCFAGG